MQFSTILVESEGAAWIITLNRPEALNALNATVITELNQALAAGIADPDTAAIILMGSEKSFAAGVDVSEMAQKQFVDVFVQDFLTQTWEQVASCPKPTIAAVSGYALGGGCELAMMCDLMIAAENARFGQPEVSLGIPPGLGGTQRLVRTIGKAKAMDMCLTGKLLSASDAERDGLVSRVVPLENLRQEAVAIANSIAAQSALAVAMTKEAINASFELPLAQGLRFERRLFHAAFAAPDQKQRMEAFVRKRHQKSAKTQS